MNEKTINRHDVWFINRKVIQADIDQERTKNDNQIICVLNILR